MTGVDCAFNIHNCVNMIQFELGSQKAKSNKKKHGVSFEEAQSVFYNDLRFNLKIKIHWVSRGLSCWGLAIIP